ncbi:hypothetical protein D9757_014022 [Collybiopsis confluens]|uniref:Fungal-type protein kinase domain-containing protein n=1 Tax=Collybiopsis confluens TaxID=2823264 RepID=A0A8H5CQE2_9AGAR|nr:hypothetical protein D9757_014022 [Collybiopsis confluens]
MQSTPLRKKPTSNSRFFGSGPGSNPASQDILKGSMREELFGQTWEFPPERLSQLLSAKTRKLATARQTANDPTETANDPPIVLENHYKVIDNVENYNCYIDTLAVAVAKAQKDFIERQPCQFLQTTDDDERSHYAGLVTILNTGLDSCKAGLGNEVQQAIYKELKFYVWDKLMDDGVDGAHPLKPDLAGVLGKAKPNSLFWSPRSKGEAGMKIPVEVKNGWSELVAQAATYARALFSANPLRQFALVIGYNHKEHVMRFLVFHRGGLTASKPLELDSEQGQKDLILLLSSILTWKNLADAGFPAWCNEHQVHLPAIYPHPVHVHSVLHYTFCVRGRAPRVYYLKIPCPADPTAVAKVARAPLDEYISPVSHTPGIRRSRRIQEKEERSQVERSQGGTPASNAVPQQGGAAPVSGIRQGHEMGSQALISGLARMSLTQDPSGINTYDNDPALIMISRDHASTESPLSAIRSPNPRSVNHLKPGDHAVLKLSWIPGRGLEHKPVEPDLLEKCGGMFGVPRHYYSFLAHHKDDCPTTNHLFLPSDTDQTARWNLFGANVSSDKIPEARSLLGHVISHAGHSLVSAPDFRSLLFALVHAHLGYYNMCQKGFQHRDISIGNVLMVDNPIESARFHIDTLGGASDRDVLLNILSLCKDLNISNQCTGFVIDGDMAVNWETYFKESHTGDKSGTYQFMSDALLEAQAHELDYWHSPIDDYYSFYYVAQWACIWSDLNKPKVSRPLDTLRTDIAGTSRGNATLKLTGLMSLETYGELLEEAQPFLQDWFQALRRLVVESRNKFENNAAGFRSLADHGLQTFLRVAHKYLVVPQS